MSKLGQEHQHSTAPPSDCLQYCTCHLQQTLTDFTRSFVPWQQIWHNLEFSFIYNQWITRKFYTIKNINSWVNQHTWKNIKGLKTFNFKWNCSCICTATYSGCACTWRQLWFVAAFLPQLQDAVIPADGLPKNEQYRDGGQAGEQEHRPCSPYSHHTICPSHNLQNTRCWGLCQCDALTRRSLCVPARQSQRRSSELSSTPSQPATQGSHMDRWLSTFCPPLAESPPVGLRRHNPGSTLTHYAFSTDRTHHPSYTC